MPLIEADAVAATEAVAVPGRHPQHGWSKDTTSRGAIAAEQEAAPGNQVHAFEGRPGRPHPVEGGDRHKGGRPRDVPVRKESQRRLLDEAHRLVGGGALIPPDRNYRQQLKVYENRTREAELYRMHGLRHHYAQTCYEEVTGWRCPATGGPSRRSLTGAQRRMDVVARRTIARELGHDSTGVVGAYIGS